MDPVSAVTGTYVDHGVYVRRAVRCAGGCGQDTYRRDPVTGEALCAACDQRQHGGGRRA